MAQHVCKHIKLGSIGNYNSIGLRSGRNGWRSQSIVIASQYYQTPAYSYHSSCSSSQRSRMRHHGKMVMPVGQRFLQLHSQTLVKAAQMCSLQSHNFSTTTSTASISGVFERLFSVKAAPVTTEEEIGQMPEEIPAEVTTQVPVQESLDFTTHYVTQEAASEPDIPFATQNSIVESASDPVNQFGTQESIVEAVGQPSFVHEIVDDSQAQIPLEASGVLDAPVDTPVQAASADTPIGVTSTADTPVVEPLTIDPPIADIPVADVSVAAGVSSEIPLVDSIQYIPPPPTPPVEEAAVQVLNALGEPTFASLGLGGWTPVGLIQSWLEFMHVSLELPWWATIALATVVLRSLLFPLVLIAQRNTAKMNNNMPQLQVLQMKMTEARNMGNHMESARLAQEMQLFMKEKEISPLKSVVVPLAQAPIFISMFLSLRKLSNYPIESMKEGGMLWFTDLTVADPFFLLPIITSLTLFATIELGTDGPSMKASNMQTMRYVIRAMPIIIFPFTFSFPTAVLCYWVSTNLFSLVQVGVLKIPTVRQYFGIEMLVKHKPDALPQKKKGFVEGFQDSWTNMRITREIEERQRVDEMKFRKAGTGPIVRTYRQDPTKRSNVINVKAVNKK